MLISGRQFADASIRRSITVDARGDYDAATARQLAAALLNAADELDQLDG